VAVLSSADTETRKDEVAYLEDVRRRLAEAGLVDVETGLLEGNIATALADYANRAQADLVVMSTHGRGALIQFFLGSIADAVVRAIPRPVLLVRASEGPVDLKATLDGKPIIVPLDGTQFAEEALGPAKEMAKLFSAPLVLTRVVEPVHLPPPE